jgi:hypothetical protein
MLHYVAQIGVGEERAHDVRKFLQPPQRADDLGLELVGSGDAGAPDPVVLQMNPGRCPDPGIASEIRERADGDDLLTSTITVSGE